MIWWSVPQLRSVSVLLVPVVEPSGKPSAVSAYRAAGNPDREWVTRLLLADSLTLVGKPQEIDALAEGWEEAAAVLAALGNPVRLEIVRRLLLGGETVQELQEIPGLGTTGQLYHHLRDLQAAGLVTQRRRGRYGVAADKVVPALIITAAAANMGAVMTTHEQPR